MLHVTVKYTSKYRENSFTKVPPFLLPSQQNSILTLLIIITITVDFQNLFFTFSSQ